jgi:hypothetical protein
MAIGTLLVACPACSCHAFARETRCPSCGAPLREPDGSVQRTAGAVLLGLSITTLAATSACGGGGGAGGAQASGGMGGIQALSAYGTPASTTMGLGGAPVTSSSGMGGVQAVSAYGVAVSTSTGPGGGDAGGD